MRLGSWCAFFPGSSVAPGGNDRSGSTGGNGGVAGPRIIILAGSHYGANRLLRRDPRERRRKRRCLAHTIAGDLDRPDRQGFRLSA